MHSNTVLLRYTVNEKESDACIPDIVEAPSRNFPHSMGLTEFFDYFNAISHTLDTENSPNTYLSPTCLHRSHRSDSRQNYCAPHEKKN